MTHRCMVNSYVAKLNQKCSRVNMKMIRYCIRDLGLVVVLGYTFYGLCLHIEEPDECGSPQEYNVMQVGLGNNRKILVNSVFMALLHVKG